MRSKKMTQKGLNKMSQFLKGKLAEIHYQTVEPDGGRKGVSMAHAAAHMVIYMRESAKMAAILTIEGTRTSKSKKDLSQIIGQKFATVYKSLKSTLDEEFADILMAFINTMVRKITERFAVPTKKKGRIK